MINALQLLWIVPVSVIIGGVVGFAVAAILAAGDDPGEEW